MNYTSCFLAFQLCIILGSSGCYCQEILSKEAHQIKEYFKANTSDVATGGPLFLNILRNWKEESDLKIIQSQLVSFYFKLFDNLKDHEVIRESVESIKEDIFVKFFNSSLTKLQDFQNLTQISVDDQQVQRKAISELSNVVNFLFSKPNTKKRKRSQSGVFRGRRASKY
ncbi:interferon gamma [Ochotona princeps]|uniref:interferon gamma n=1 Tax=Ochotona princeps TaxID=9978 RepID=UPI00032B1B5C|nr:interferon gamma [Ochotona princeps]